MGCRVRGIPCRRHQPLVSGANAGADHGICLPLQRTLPKLSRRLELDQLLAPIALYPDPLLAQILMAATYPIEVVEAARWSKDNPNLTGDAALAAVKDKGWDASVTSLFFFFPPPPPPPPPPPR